MHFVYVLKSLKDDNFYVGCTGDLKKRFLLHNAGKIISTKGRGPFHLIYYEAYRSKADAFAREQNLKLRKRAFYQLKQRISKSLVGR